MVGTFIFVCGLIMSVVMIIKVIVGLLLSIDEITDIYIMWIFIIMMWTGRFLGLRL